MNKAILRSACSFAGLLYATAAAGSSQTPEVVQTATAPAARPWTNSRQSPDVRARQVLSAMTDDEKLSLLSTPLTALLAMMGNAPPSVPITAGYLRGIPRLGLPAVIESDSGIGVSNTGDIRKGDVATALPASIALGASFDPKLAFAGGQMIGSEARAKGFGIMLAGGANLIRDPRAGRNFEYISEDPLLSGKIAGQAIAGVQSNRIVSTLKHFAVNDQETGRFVYDVKLSEGAMRESDLLAFEIALETGRPGSVMCAYNRVNSVYACENRFLLTDVLRRDWGFDGFVMSDWGAVHSMGALDAGLDQQSGYQADTRHFFGKDLKEALGQGKIEKTLVDRAAFRILRTFFAHGVYDAPPQGGTAIDYEANAKIAQAQAEAGIVLLKNDGNVLPLAGSAKRIAVIGAHADAGVLFGGGSAQVIPVGGVKLAISKSNSGLESLVKRSYGGTSPVDAIRKQFPAAEVEFFNGADPEKAAAVARTVEVVIFFAEKWSSEGSDSPDLSLGEGQDETIAAIAAANPRTVVVLQTGNAVLMPWEKQVPAILEAWYPGQRGAEAIANVLSGATNPSGRLPITFPMSVNQLPNPEMPGSKVAAPPKVPGSNPLLDKVPFSYTYPEGSDAGYRWFDRSKARPLYPFGHGLSFTNFAYSALQVRSRNGLSVQFKVTNSGRRRGTDTPQVYVSADGRAKRLVGWDRVTLGPGQSKTVTLTVDPRVLGNFRTDTVGWEVSPGTYRVEVGPSATDVTMTKDVQLAEARFPASSFRPKR